MCHLYKDGGFFSLSSQHKWKPYPLSIYAQHADSLAGVSIQIIFFCLGVKRAGGQSYVGNKNGQLVQLFTFGYWKIFLKTN
jgi:hypothetical protein